MMSLHENDELDDAELGDVELGDDELDDDELGDKTHVFLFFSFQLNVAKAIIYQMLSWWIFWHGHPPPPPPPPKMVPRT